MPSAGRLAYTAGHDNSQVWYAEHTQGQLTCALHGDARSGRMAVCRRTRHHLGASSGGVVGRRAYCRYTDSRGELALFLAHERPGAVLALKFVGVVAISYRASNSCHHQTKTETSSRCTSHDMTHTVHQCTASIAKALSTRIAFAWNTLVDWYRAVLASYLCSPSSCAERKY